MARTREAVLRQRLATQRLTSPPAPDPTAVVRLLTCVQAQDAPLARYSLGLRCAAEHDPDILAAQTAGTIVRTHILRPTWHFVAAEDLRWIQQVTAATVEAALASRHRQLGLSPQIVADSLAALAELLANRNHLTWREIGDQLEQRGLPGPGPQLGHVLLLAELRALVCSGPPRQHEHTYALVDEVIAPGPTLERADAVRELVRRYIAGHGPASIEDLQRWSPLPESEVLTALADLDDQLESARIDERTLWFDPAAPARPGGRPRRRAFLLPTFDEAYLSYRQVTFPRAAGHPLGTTPHSVAEAGGGVIVCDLRDVGWWKRQVTGDEMTVSLALASDITPDQRDEAMAAAEHLATFAGHQLQVDLHR